MDKILISHIGLTLKDIRALHNLFQLSTTWLGNFDLVSEPNSPKGEILLVNTDEPRSRKSWEMLSRLKDFERVISIGTEKANVIPGSVHLRRPLVSRRVSDSLKAATALRQEAEGHTFRILVVDDSLPVRTFMQQKLHDMLGDRLGVDMADCGEAALQLVAAHSYHLVFMDVVMPGMDGYKACRSIKTLSQSNSKVVMLTSKSSAINRVKAKMSGCDGYITKPPEDKALNEALRQHLPMERVTSTPAATQDLSEVNGLQLQWR